MAATVIVNGQTVIHKDSEGIVTTRPDVCVTPAGNALIPVPYLNVARSADISGGSPTVSIDGNPVMLKDSVFGKSTGDEPGVFGGISSGVTGGKAKCVNYSNDVFIDGKPVCRRLDAMISNVSASGNTPPAPLMQPNLAAEGDEAEGHSLCISFIYKEPDVLTGRVTQPILDLSYTITGPETLKNDGSEPYVGKLHKIERPGEFYFKFDEIDLDEVPIGPVEPTLGN